MGRVERGECEVGQRFCGEGWAVGGAGWERPPITV